MLKKTAYDLAGIQIRPAITCLNTGESFLWHPATAPGLAHRDGFWTKMRRVFFR